MQIREVILRDTRANQPVAGDENDGFLYFVTDESVLERSNGTSWESVSPVNAPDWGDIGGTLSDQTDLQAELDAKEDTIGYVPENTANKATTMAGNTGSNTLFLTAKAIYDWAVATFQSALGFTPEDSANKDTDGTLSANSDVKYASQKATKTYADTKLPSSYLDTDGTLSANSDAKVASQKATKTYADGKVSDTAYADSWDGATGVAPSKNAVYDKMEDTNQATFLKMSRALGSSLRAISLGGFYPTTNYTLADGTWRCCAIYVPEAFTSTGVAFYMVTQGSFTGDQTNSLALYSYSGGTLTKIAETANDANIWKNTTSSFVKVPWSSTVALTPGIYYVAFLYNNSAQTTAPVVGAPLSVVGGFTTLDYTNSAKTIGSISAQNSHPSPQALSGASAQTSGPWAGIY